MCAIMPPEFMQLNTAGLPMPSVEIKLLDVPEAGYLSTNNPPQGEVCIRGPSVIKGYFKRDDLNNDESIFTKDGWFRTGDVAQWNPDGTLRIIDRSVHVLLSSYLESCRGADASLGFLPHSIKNLVKLRQGEVSIGPTPS